MAEKVINFGASRLGRDRGASDAGSRMRTIADAVGGAAVINTDAITFSHACFVKNNQETDTYAVNCIAEDDFVGSTAAPTDAGAKVIRLMPGEVSPARIRRILALGNTAAADLLFVG